MHLVREPLARFDPRLPEIPLRAERRQLAKRLWRGQAADGEEFGFDLAEPLRDGDTVWESSLARYVIRQDVEPLLVVELNEGSHSAALVGWTIGNYHFPVEVQPGGLVVPADDALRQALTRAGIPFTETKGVFRPHRLAAESHAHEHDVR